MVFKIQKPRTPLESRLVSGVLIIVSFLTQIVLQCPETADTRCDSSGVRGFWILKTMWEWQISLYKVKTRRNLNYRVIFDTDSFAVPS